MVTINTVNGWVSDIVSTVSTADRCKIYLFTAFVKHSQESKPFVTFLENLDCHWTVWWSVMCTVHVWQALVRHTPILQLYYLLWKLIHRWNTNSHVCLYHVLGNQAHFEVLLSPKYARLTFFNSNQQADTVCGLE